MLAGGTSLEGGNIIVVSDGQENEPPLVLDVLPEVSYTYFNYHQVQIFFHSPNKFKLLSIFTLAERKLPKLIRNIKILAQQIVNR